MNEQKYSPQLKLYWIQLIDTLAVEEKCPQTLAFLNMASNLPVV